MGKRTAVDYLVGEERLPVRVACEAIGLARATYYKKPAGLREKDQLVIDAWVGQRKKALSWSLSNPASPNKTLLLKAL